MLDFLELNEMRDNIIEASFVPDGQIPFSKSFIFASPDLLSPFFQTLYQLSFVQPLPSLVSFINVCLFTLILPPNLSCPLCFQVLILVASKLKVRTWNDGRDQ